MLQDQNLCCVCELQTAFVSCVNLVLGSVSIPSARKVHLSKLYIVNIQTVSVLKTKPTQKPTEMENDDRRMKRIILREEGGKRERNCMQHW